MKSILSIFLSFFTFLFPLFTPAAPIEAEYAKRGEYTVETAQISVDDGCGSSWYRLYYPEGLTDAEYPAIVFLNGTGATCKWYNGLLRTLASRGYIVIGNDVRMSRTGDSGIAMAKYLLDADADPDSVFYSKIDESRIGVCGHSQGGDAAADCAVFDSENGFSFASLCTIEMSVNTEYNEALIIDFADIDCPVFMSAGTGFFDSSIITPLDFMTENFNALSGEYPAVMSRSKCTDHADICLLKNGGYQTPYIAAWFDYTLKGDAHAAEVFTRSGAEILTSARWQDTLIK